jgi:hypothetical protein
MNNTNDKIIELASDLVDIIKDLNNKQYNLTAGVYLAELSNLLKTRNI